MWASAASSLSQAPERNCPSPVTLFVLGINHQTAPVGLRERVAFSADAVPAALASLRALPPVREAALLSTCNRTEIYALADDDAETDGEIDGDADADADVVPPGTVTSFRSRPSNFFVSVVAGNEPSEASAVQVNTTFLMRPAPETIWEITPAIHTPRFASR